MANNSHECNQYCTRWQPLRTYFFCAVLQQVGAQWGEFCTTMWDPRNRAQKCRTVELPVVAPIVTSVDRSR